MSGTEPVPVFLDLTALVTQADQGAETSASSGAHFVDVDGDNGQGDGDQAVQSEHAVVNASTVVPRGQSAPVSSTEPALPAQFKTAPVAERAELQIEDLSLRFDNPYLPSSLVPPMRRRFGKGAIMVVTGAVVGAVATFAGGSLFPPASLLARNSERPAPMSEVAISAAPAPVKPSAAREMQALPPVVVGAKAAGVPSDGAGASSASTPMPPVTASEPREPVKMAATPEVAKKPKSSMRRNGARRSRSAKPMPVSAEPAIAGAPASTSVVDASLPLAPSREEVVAVFGRLRAQMWRCAAGNKGVVEIQATITGEGRISNALISGVFSGTPEGSCMARAVRAGSFSPFSQPKVTVSFPIAL